MNFVRLNIVFLIRSILSNVKNILIVAIRISLEVLFIVLVQREKKFIVNINYSVIHTFDICYVSAILKADSKVVISFFKRDKSISLGLPFSF
jgi:hypothetical protein